MSGGHIPLHAPSKAEEQSSMLYLPHFFKYILITMQGG